MEKAGPGIRRSPRAPLDRRPGPRRPWGKSNRPHVHRGRLRRFSFCRAPSRGICQPTGIHIPRRRLTIARRVHHRRGALRSAGQSSSPIGDCSVPTVFGSGNGSASPGARRSRSRSHRARRVSGRDIAKRPRTRVYVSVCARSLVRSRMVSATAVCGVSSEPTEYANGAAHVIDDGRGPRRDSELSERIGIENRVEEGGGS